VTFQDQTDPAMFNYRFRYMYIHWNKLYGIVPIPY